MSSSVALFLFSFFHFMYMDCLCFFELYINKHIIIANYIIEQHYKIIHNNKAIINFSVLFNFSVCFQIIGNNSTGSQQSSLKAYAESTRGPKEWS